MLTTVSQGARMPINLFHSIGYGVTPTSSTLKIFAGSNISPYFAQVGADIDILVSGAVIDGTTGWYGYNIDTSAYALGQYVLYHTWEYSGMTHEWTGEFVVEATSTSTAVLIEQMGNRLASAIQKLPVPLNGVLLSIGETLGITKGKGQFKANKDFLPLITGARNDIAKVRGLNLDDKVSMSASESVSTRRNVENMLNNLSSDILPRYLNSVNSALANQAEVIKYERQEEQLINLDTYSAGLDVNAEDMMVYNNKLDMLGQQVSQLSQLTQALAQMIATNERGVQENVQG